MKVGIIGLGLIGGSIALKLKEVNNNITIYGPSDNRIAIVCFNIDDIHSGDISQLLDYEGITLRSGRHCCSPLMTKLNISSCLRLSLYFYNDITEIDLFIDKLKKAITTLS